MCIHVAAPAQVCPGPVRRGGLANLVSAVRHVMTRPDSVAVLLDLDDALIGRGVLETLRGAYDSGADFTVGTVLRFKVRPLWGGGVGGPRVEMCNEGPKPMNVLDSGADFTVGTVLRLKVRLGRRLVMAPRAYGHGLRRPVPNIGKSE